MPPPPAAVATASPLPFRLYAPPTHMLRHQVFFQFETGGPFLPSFALLGACMGLVLSRGSVHGFSARTQALLVVCYAIGVFCAGFTPDRNHDHFHEVLLLVAQISLCVLFYPNLRKSGCGDFTEKLLLLFGLFMAGSITAFAAPPPAASSTASSSSGLLTFVARRAAIFSRALEAMTVLSQYRACVFLNDTFDFRVYGWTFCFAALELFKSCSTHHAVFNMGYSAHHAAVERETGASEGPTSWVASVGRFLHGASVLLQAFALLWFGARSTTLLLQVARSRRERKADGAGGGGAEGAGAAGDVNRLPDLDAEMAEIRGLMGAEDEYDPEGQQTFEVDGTGPLPGSRGGTAGVSTFSAAATSASKALRQFFAARTPSSFASNRRAERVL